MCGCGVYMAVLCLHTWVGICMCTAVPYMHGCGVYMGRGALHLEEREGGGRSKAALTEMAVSIPSTMGRGHLGCCGVSISIDQTPGSAFCCLILLVAGWLLAFGHPTTETQRREVN